MATSPLDITSSSDDEDLTQSVFARAAKPVVNPVTVSVKSEEDGYLSPDTPSKVVKTTTVELPVLIDETEAVEGYTFLQDTFPVLVPNLCVFIVRVSC